MCFQDEHYIVDACTAPSITKNLHMTEMGGNDRVYGQYACTRAITQIRLQVSSPSAVHSAQRLVGSLYLNTLESRASQPSRDQGAEYRVRNPTVKLPSTQQPASWAIRSSVPCNTLALSHQTIPQHPRLRCWPSHTRAQMPRLSLYPGHKPWHEP